MRRSGEKRRLAVDRHQVLILVFGAVMVGSFIMFVLWPKQCELSDLGSAVAHERQCFKEKVLARRTGQLMTVGIPEIRQDLALLDRRLPPEPRLDRFLEGVARCVALEPQVVSELTRGTGEVEGLVAAVPVRLRLVGPFAAVQRCTASIEGMERLCRFRQACLKRADDGRVVMDAEVLVYYLPVVGGGGVASSTADEAPLAERSKG